MGMCEAARAEKRRGLTRLEVGNALWLNKTPRERREPIRLAILLAACYGALSLLPMIPSRLDPMFALRYVRWTGMAYLVVFTFLPVVPLAYVLTAVRRRPEAMLRYHVCACCGYDLRGAVPEDDGCSVCPECGSAYNLSGRAAPLGRTLRPVWWIVPWFDDRRRHVRRWGRLDPIAPEAARSIQKQFGLGRRATWWVLGYLLIAVTIVFLAGRAWVDDPETLTVYSFFFVVGLGMWLIAWMTKRALRRARYCVACYESLHDVETDADGCTACPVCGAAWRVGSHANSR